MIEETQLTKIIGIIGIIIGLIFATIAIIIKHPILSFIEIIGATILSYLLYITQKGEEERFRFY